MGNFIGKKDRLNEFESLHRVMIWRNRLDDNFEVVGKHSDIRGSNIVVLALKFQFQLPIVMSRSCVV